MIGSVALLNKNWSLCKSHNSRVGRICPELCGLVQPKMQLKAKPNIQTQGRGFESRLCHTELNSGKNGVGLVQHL